MSCANAELNAKCSSPPATRNRGLIATCSTAIPAPITKSEVTAIEYVGKAAKLAAPKVAATKEAPMGFFSPQRCTANPAGIDNTPYAMKNANGKIAAIVSDTWKSVMMSGINGPRIFVRKEITKNTKNTTATRNRLLPPVAARIVDVIVIRSYLVDDRRVATLRGPLEGPLHDRHLADVVFRVHPERFVHEAAEDFARQDGSALDRFHLRAHRMQAGHADAGVELVRVVGNAFEVMFEPGFADELVDRAHGGRRIARQAFVGQQQQVARGILTIERILGGLEGEPHHAARIGQRLDSRVNRGIGF